jgi:hypothetical protein
MRQEKTKPVLEKFFEICKRVLASTQGRLAKAINYALERENEAKTFLNDGNCDIDNNTAENHIRPFVISRKNSLFNFTEAGADCMKSKNSDMKVPEYLSLPQGHKYGLRSTYFTYCRDSDYS